MSAPRRLVIDSSVAVKWFVDELYSPQARQILAAFQAGSLELLVPDLINAEVGNIIWKKQTFQGFAPADAQKVIDGFLALPLTSTPTAGLLPTAYRLAVAHRRSVYDMLYLALSVREQCRLVTADERLINAVSAAYPDVLWVARWP
jgi:predicted nucleic acid-binding protein